MERQDVLRQFINMTKAKAYYHTVTVSASVCVHTSTPQHELNTSCLPVPVRHFYKLQVNKILFWVALVFLRDATDRLFQQFSTRTLGTLKLKLVGARIGWQFCQVRLPPFALGNIQAELSSIPESILLHSFWPTSILLIFVCLLTNKMRNTWFLFFFNFIRNVLQHCTQWLLV